MRFINKSVSSCEHEPSSPRSYHSSTSFEIFGSACSDLSDCEYCDDRRKRMREKPYTPSSSSSHSYHSAMSREAAPLLTAAPSYNAIHSSSSSDSLGPGEISASDILDTYRKQFSDELKPASKKQSSLVTIFSVWNTIMGSSLLTMAWGVERAGLSVALVLLVCMAALCLYTAGLLLNINTMHGSASCEVPFLCRSLLGRGAEALAHVFSFVVLLGANVVYWILITNFLYFTVNYFVDLNASNATTYNSSLLCPTHDPQLVPAAESPYWGLHSTVPVYVALIVFPLLNFKNVSFFTKFNSLGTLSVVYLLIFVVIKAYSWGINIPAGAGAPGTGAAGAGVLSGMLALSFYIHNMIITIMSNNARQENNSRDLTLAFILVTVTYMSVGALFYICFPLAKSCIEDNILNNFEFHDVMTAIARILLLFQVITVYPLVAFMLRSEAVLLLPLRDTRRLTVAINAVIVLVCILFACFCPSIGTIIRYTGAVSGLVHVFTLPSLLQLRSLHLRDKLTLWNILFYSSIIVFGAVNLIMQFFI